VRVCGELMRITTTIFLTAAICSCAPRAQEPPSRAELAIAFRQRDEALAVLAHAVKGLLKEKEESKENGQS
jgi:hypothetical protein